MFLLPGRRLEPGEVVYTDWVYRAGDNVIIRAEAFQSEASASAAKVTLTFYTKNSDDTGDGEAIESGGVELELDVQNTSETAFDIEELIITSAGTAEPPEGVEEMLRCRVECASGANTGWVTVRIFEPIFFDEASP
jgi:hypothetical protein